MLIRASCSLQRRGEYKLHAIGDSFTFDDVGGVSSRGFISRAIYHPVAARRFGVITASYCCIMQEKWCKRNGVRYPFLFNPYGSERWVSKAVARFGMENTPRNPCPLEMRLGAYGIGRSYTRLHRREL